MKERTSSINVIFLIVLLSGCTRGDEHFERDRHSLDLCKYRGNRADANYCAISVLQLFANPNDYDQRKIFVHAWATGSGDSIYIFPTKDSADSADTVSSLVVPTGKALPDLKRWLKDRSGVPIKVSVGGTFVLNRKSKEGMTLAGFDSDRFGALINVDEAYID